MKIRHASAAALVLLFVAQPAMAGELANDGFTVGQTPGFQGGFVSGEIGASRFDAGATPASLRSVRFLFGPAGATKVIALHVWDDDARSLMPGGELHSAQYEVTAADDAMQEIDLSSDNLVVQGPFRVGVEVTHDGFPGIARDDDGTIQPDANFILASGLGWKEASALGVTGDWILRATVEAQASGGSGGSGGSGTAGSGGAGASGGTGGSPGGMGGSGRGDEDAGCGCASGADGLPDATLFLAAAAALLRARRRRRLG
jgi:MYXO-CTERM domain-containing protein